MRFDATPGEPAAIEATLLGAARKARLSRFKLRVRVVATDAAGNQSTAKKTVRLRRR